MDRWTRQLVAPLLAVTLAACSESTAPADLVELQFDYCSGPDTPVFFAFQNDGGAWETITPDANGTFTLSAAPKLGLAAVFQLSANTFFTDIIFATRDELEPLSGGACTEGIGTKTLSGSVANVDITGAARVSMADDFEDVRPPQSTYTLVNLPSVPVDLVAHREAAFTTNITPDRVIVRRGLNLTNGATIPVLDFGAAEAVVPTQSVATITGLAGNETNSVSVEFSTATTRHSLSITSGFTAASQTIYGIPASLTQQGDLHRLTVDAFSSDQTRQRGAQLGYRVPGPKSIALGSPLNTPAITTAATTPSVRLRAQLPKQTEYASFVNVIYSQGNGARTVSVTGTADFFDNPQSWDLVMPDLTASGFPSAAGLQAGQTLWSVDAYSGSATDFLGGLVEGATLVYAGQASSVGAAQMGQGISAQSQPETTADLRRLTRLHRRLGRAVR